MKCEHGEKSWTECETCRKSSTYLRVGPRFKGTGWTGKSSLWVGDLPPHEEVAARRKEQGVTGTPEV